MPLLVNYDEKPVLVACAIKNKRIKGSCRQLLSADNGTPFVKGSPGVYPFALYSLSFLVQHYIYIAYRNGPWRKKSSS